MVPYMDAVVAVTVMRVLLFVLHVCMLSVRVRGRRKCWCGCGECRACVWYTWFKYCV